MVWFQRRCFKMKHFLALEIFLGQLYIAKAVPVKEFDGRIVGAIAVGYPVRELSGIGRIIQSSKVGDSGFPLADSKDQLLYVTEGRSLEKSQAIVDSIDVGSGQSSVQGVKAGDYRISSFLFKPWNYKIYVAASISEINARTARSVTESHVADCARFAFGHGSYDSA